MSLQNGFFILNSANPDLPPETWELVYEKTNTGNYTFNADWGKYKIILSGGGGGGAIICQHNTAVQYYNGGSSGEEKILFYNVLSNTQSIFSGIIGSGGGGAFTLNYGSWNNINAYSGAVGTGYSNGTLGQTYTYHNDDRNIDITMAGGSGGGSSSLNIDGVLLGFSRGGNGGAASSYTLYATPVVNGGVGGNGGVSSGTGAAGGNGYQYSNHSNASAGTGNSGYIRIYKSNLKPEPL
jgi:hypothetical protein